MSTEKIFEAAFWRIYQYRDYITYTLITPMDFKQYTQEVMTAAVEAVTQVLNDGLRAITPPVPAPEPPEPCAALHSGSATP